MSSRGDGFGKDGVMTENLNISDNVPVLPPQAKRTELSYMVTRLILGAKVHKDFKGHKDSVAIEAEGQFWPLSLQDFELVNRALDRVKAEVDGSRMVSAEQVLKIHRLAANALETMTETNRGYGVVMLKDSAGSGYWRMVLPARYMDRKGLFVDVTASAVKFEHLLEYNTVYVQRVHDWDSYYTLEKLKQTGKRLVYDIDDDIFAIPLDNPASRVIGREEQAAALACMRLADCVTTTTPVLQGRLTQLMDGRVPLVIPNALDPDAGWFPTEQTGSPDGWKRIFWQGSATHASDWLECIEAVDEVMRANEKVRLVILGFLPPAVQARLGQPHWRGRVEYVGFNSPETYFEIAKHVKAEVGIAPLEQSYFNEAKSCIKWLEYSLMGMPTVASDWGPYREAITEVTEGFLCSTKEDWVEAITTCLFKRDERLKVVKAARKRARESYNIKGKAKTWRDILVHP